MPGNSSAVYREVSYPLRFAHWLLFLSLLLIPTSASAAIDVHFFWSTDCRHCRAMSEMLGEIVAEEPDLELHVYEVEDLGNRQLFERLINGEDLPPGVPLVLVGDVAIVGHGTHSRDEVLRMIAACRAEACPDLLAAYRIRIDAKPAEMDPGSPAEARNHGKAAKLRLPERIDLPLFGEIETARMSLPLLTIAMAAIDGFNPCAMWVLVFLVGILLGIEDRRRMWLLAGTFLLATAAVYYLVLAAWLNVLLMLGAIAWLRVAIGAVAVVAGGVYLREGLRRSQVCPVTQPDRRRRIFERLRSLVQQPNLAAAMAGITLLAIAVNMVELLCSAGVPAVYTGILAQSHLSALEYHAYLALYVGVFLADDSLVVVIALTTLRMAGNLLVDTRWARLAGGTVMLALGLLLIFRPGWLSFSA